MAFVGKRRGRGMKGVELYAQVRYAVQIEGLSRREAARRYGIDPRTVAKMLAFSVPPGYRRSRPPARPKLDPFTGIIEQILLEDEGRPRKQRHTSKRIFERLRDEHGYSGGITIVKDYVLARRLRHREVFVPLGSSARSTSLRWTCRTATPVLCRPIRRRPPKRSVTGTTPPSRSSARCRARSCTTTRRWRWRASWAMGCDSARVCSASCSPITCLTTGSAGPAKATTKAKSRG